MTSFASAFGPTDQGQIYSHTFEINSTNDIENGQRTNHFSNIDLDQQPTSFTSDQSLYASLNDAVTFQPDLSSTAGAIPHTPSHSPSFSSQQIFARKSFSPDTMTDRSSPSFDRQISVPPMSRLSASSAVAVAAAVGPTIDKFKQWSRLTFKCTKQSIYEKLGKTTRTVDVELENRIEQLRETKRRYEDMLALARSYTNHFYNLMQTQKALSDQFLDLKQKSSLLADEFHYNAETQRLLARNGEKLLQALNYFISTMNTLCTKTMEDTITTVRLYETARLEYDVCRTELALLSPGSQFNEKQGQLEKHKDKYEQLKNDTSVKLKLLDENQIKVMKHQLLLFHNAIAAYFSGNKETLDATMKQFSLKVISTNDISQDTNSFLEQTHH